MKWTLALGLFALTLACSPSDPQEDRVPAAGIFVDVTAESGLAFAFDRAGSGGYFMPDSLAGGCALLDYDADGDLDVYLVLGVFENGAPHPSGANRLFRQGTDGTFVDMSAGSGADDRGYGMGVAVGDIDNDGDADLFVTNYGPNVLLRNDGDGTFTDITDPAGVGDARWGSSTGFVDFDRDGFLDLFVTNYVQYTPGPEVRDAAGQPEYAGPDCCSGTPDILYRNNRDGTFDDVSEEVGIHDALGKGLGVGFADLDFDGLIDIYVANDGEANRAWVHDPSGSARDAAGSLGIALNGYGAAEAGMGVVVTDLDQDLSVDLFVTHLFQETNTLYLGAAGGRFADATLGSGLGKQSADRTGFGVTAIDVDLDGRPELAVANGRVLRAHAQSGADHWGPYEEKNLLFWNEGEGRFRQLADECGSFCDAGVHRGLAAGDVDNDGDADLLMTSADGRARLLRNTRPRDGHWLGFQLVDTQGVRDATGAIVELRVGDRTLRNAVAPSSSYLSSHDPRVLFGLGPAQGADEIRVTWPDGEVETFDAVAVDRYHELVRGKGTDL